jgi:hypothetical protein
MGERCPACAAAVRLADNTVVGGRLTLASRACCGWDACPKHRSAAAAWNLSLGRSVDAYVASKHSEGCPNQGPPSTCALRCHCTYEAGDSECPVHPTCADCGSADHVYNERPNQERR